MTHFNNPRPDLAVVGGTDHDGRSPPLPPSGGNGGDGMEERLRKVEQAVVRIDTILPTLATKVDVAELKVGIAELRSEFKSQTINIIVWMIGTAVACIGLLLTGLKFIIH